MTVAADRAAARKSTGAAARKSSTPSTEASGRRPARAPAVEHLSRAERAARGKDARAVAPLESHGEFSPGRGRDPVGLLLGQAESRVPELVPVRHGRMLVSPFTYYRGAALPMAADPTAAAYHTAMREFPAMAILNVGYARFDAEDALAELKSDLPKKAVRQTRAQMAKARTRDSTQALAKLTTGMDGRRRIISDPPLIIPLEELAGHLDVDAAYRFLRRLFSGYARTLPAYQRRLVERFTLT